MKTIEIDDEVYSFLQQKAIAYEETPNLTLRRILVLNKRKNISYNSKIKKDRKKPKTNLLELINAGKLHENQILFLYDYRGNKIEGISAKISNGSLIYEDLSYSMSELAKILLKQNGYESDSVRGPAFWFTEQGESIKDIWGRYLDSHGGL